MEDKTKLKLWENIKYENEKTTIGKSQIVERNKENVFHFSFLEQNLGKSHLWLDDSQFTLDLHFSSLTL